MVAAEPVPSNRILAISHQWAFFRFRLLCGDDDAPHQSKVVLSPPAANHNESRAIQTRQSRPTLFIDARPGNACLRLYSPLFGCRRPVAVSLVDTFADHIFILLPGGAVRHTLKERESGALVCGTGVFGLKLVSILFN